MGWSEAHEIFDGVAQGFIDAKATREVKIRALVPLIKGLQESDWDTEDVSMEIFQHDPDIMDAFRQAGVVCEAEKALISFLYDNTHLSRPQAEEVAETLLPVITAHVDNYRENGV